MLFQNQWTAFVPLILRNNNVALGEENKYNFICADIINDSVSSDFFANKILYMTTHNNKLNEEIKPNYIVPTKVLLG